MSISGPYDLEWLMCPPTALGQNRALTGAGRHRETTDIDLEGVANPTIKTRPAVTQVFEPPPVGSSTPC